MTKQTTTSPEWASGSAVRSRFNSIVFGYDFWSKITESDALKRALEFADIRDGMHVLELASGTGRFFRWVVHANPQGINVGIEISGGMIQSTLKKLNGESSHHWNIIQGDIRALPLQRHHWDRVVGNYVFDLLPREWILPVLKSMAPLLRREGKLVISTMAHGNRWYHKAWEGIANRFPQLLTYCHPIAIASEMEKAGFGVQRQDFISQNTFPSEVTVAVPTESSNQGQQNPTTLQEEYHA